MFEQDLHGLVKGLRDCKTDTETQAYIAKALTEIKQELSSREIHVKATAIQKASYVRLAAWPLGRARRTAGCRDRWLPSRALLPAACCASPHALGCTLAYLYCECGCGVILAYGAGGRRLRFCSFIFFWPVPMAIASGGWRRGPRRPPASLLIATCLCGAMADVSCGVYCSCTCWATRSASSPSKSLK
jgi:hypothetical protein